MHLVRNDNPTIVGWYAIHIFAAVIFGNIHAPRHLGIVGEPEWGCQDRGAFLEPLYYLEVTFVVYCSHILLWLLNYRQSKFEIVFM